MPADRCPRCGAVVKPGADWCTLCYADLRPPPAPVVRPSPAVAPRPAGAQTGAALALSELVDGDVPLSVRLGVGDSVRLGAGDTALAPADAVDARPRPFWPCPSCGTQNDIDANACTECGAGFLVGAVASATYEKVPGADRLRTASKGTRYGLAFAGMIVVTGVFFLLLVLLGSLLG